MPDNCTLYFLNLKEYSPTPLSRHHLDIYSHIAGGFAIFEFVYSGLTPVAGLTGLPVFLWYIQACTGMINLSVCTPTVSDEGIRMSDPQMGQLLAFMSALCFAGGGVFISKAAKLRGDTGVLFSIFVTMVFSCLLWLILEKESLNQEWDRDWWAGIAWFIVAGLFAMVFGRSLLYASIRHLGVTRSSSVKRLNPFFSALLAWIFLAEPITAWDGVGMLAIAIAFVMLIQNTERSTHLDPSEDQLTTYSYMWGVGAALAYAFAYIARKYGLAYINAPIFGTMISAVSGFVFFVLAGMLVPGYRKNLRNTFTNLNRWLVLAGICVSSGQILSFAALYYETVTTVVMINSLEIFLASFLSVVVFRTEKRPDLITCIAAVIATVGVIIIATG
jgi:drug/metabolite transporter (DMT)-like permease